jgi:uncharacterized protein (TIGR03086 family)
MATQQPQVADAVDLLARALAQAAEVLARVREEQLGAPTPCEEWTVGQLVDHLVAAPHHFAQMMRGERADFSSPPPQVGSDREQRLRAAGDELLAVWREQGEEAQGSVDWQLAELAVHTWDLARATGQSTGNLDPEVARRGLAFMEQNLSADNRGRAFGPPRPAPTGTDAYGRIAAFAGRGV